MHLIAIIFWTSLIIIFYSYFGYGLILVALDGIKRLIRRPAPVNRCEEGALPEVTLVVAAYNEEGIIREKIRNCLSLNYPAAKISFLFITDGSEDNTPGIVAAFPRIQLLHEDERKGKTAALNRAMAYVKTPITIFCDANAMLNKSSIRRLVAHYSNPKTGGVSGEKRVVSTNCNTMTGTGEGLYWRYESLIKKLDARLYTVTGAAGELFSIRTELWEELPEDAILDDFVISSRINMKGFRIAYEPSAYACELPSASIDEERKRKIRLAAGAFQAMVITKGLFNFFKHPVLFFQFFSHRFLRWTLTPLSIPVLLAANAILVAGHPNFFYSGILAAQAVVYLLAIRGLSVKSELKMNRVTKICYYVLFMNYSIYIGFIRFLKGKQSAVWEKAGREVLMAGGLR